MDDRFSIVAKDLLDRDVLDENLYSYENAIFTLTPAIQRRTSENLIRKIEQYVNSSPAIQKAIDSLQDRIEYIPRLDMLTDEIKKLLQEGKAEIIPLKNPKDTFYLQIRTAVKGIVINGKEYGKSKKIKDIPLSTRKMPTDITGAMQCLSMQGQLNKISDGLKEISEACKFNFERIIQGQRDDRIAKLLGSRSSFLQALAISDRTLQQQMLLQAIHGANSARAELAFQIKSDIILLGCEKALKSKDMERIVFDINTAIIAMNNAVQISLYSYQTLGEHDAQLLVVKEHETFIKQVLLKEIEYEGKNHSAWNLICSSGNSKSVPQGFHVMPTNLVNSCVAFIEDKNKTKIIGMEDKIND